MSVWNKINRKTKVDNWIIFASFNKFTNNHRTSQLGLVIRIWNLKSYIIGKHKALTWTVVPQNVVRDARWNEPGCPQIGILDGTGGRLTPLISSIWRGGHGCLLFHYIIKQTQGCATGWRAVFHKQAANKPVLIKACLHHCEKSICLIGQLLSNILAQDLLETIILKSVNEYAFSC